MPNSLSRRTFVGGSAATLGFAFAGAGSLDPFTSSAAAATRTSRGYGPLVAAGPLLALPKGFSYRVIGRSGVPGAGGFVYPGDPDAMGRFTRRGGGSVLVTNHEMGGADQYPVPHVDGLAYDPGGSAAPPPSTSTTTAPARAVRQPRRHVQQLRRRHHPVGHLADLRGDRGTRAGERA